MAGDAQGGSVERALTGKAGQGSPSGKLSGSHLPRYRDPMGPVITFLCQTFPAWCVVCVVPPKLWGPSPCPLGWRGFGDYLGWWGGKTRIASRCSRMGGNNVCAGLELLRENRTLGTEQKGLLSRHSQAGEPAGLSWPPASRPPSPPSFATGSVLAGISQ